MKRIYYILFLLAIAGNVLGQNERKFVRSGNRLFMDAVRDTTKIDSVKFSNAETEYSVITSYSIHYTKLYEGRRHRECDVLSV